MANDTQMTIVGNLVDAPDLRFTQSGVAVAVFTVASTPRTFNRQTNEWEDGEAVFMRCEVWRDMAENVAESLAKGSRVVVYGNFRPNNYTDREGVQRYGFKLDVLEVGPSLKYATAIPNKVQRNGGGRGAPQGASQGGYGGPAQGQGGYGPQGGQQGGYGPQGGQQAAADPWAGGGQQGGYDDPPFM